MSDIRIKIYRLLLEPHASITDPLERRVAHLLTIFLILSFPIVPIVWLFQEYVEIPEGMTIQIGTVVPLVVASTVIYFIARSRHYKISVYSQIVLGFLYPYALSIHMPEAQANFHSLIFCVCLTGLLLNFRRLVQVSLIVIVGYIGLFLLVSPVYHKSLLSSLIIFLILVLLLLLTRYHYNWVEEYRLQRLSEQNAKYLNVLDQTFDGTAIVKNLVLLSVSTGFAKVFQQSSEDLQGKIVTDLLPGLVWPIDAITELSFQQDNGKVRFIQIVSEDMDEHENMVAIRDITQERVEQAVRLQMDRMTSTGTLAAGIAHELNTPLMIAMNQCQMALQDCETKDEKIASRLSTTQEVLSRMADIVKDLKWFVQPSTSQFTVSPKAVIENTVRLANHRIGHLSSIEIEADVEVAVQIAENQLSQIIMNLLFNAVNAKRAEQQVVTINIKCHIQGDTFCLAVSDDGKGISESEKEKIFEPFYTSGPTKGTGLGLAICHALVAQVGGMIFAQNNPSYGATFVVHLPFLDSTLLSKEKKTQKKEVKKIVIIDDEPGILALLPEMLRDYKCFTASNIQDGLDLVTNHNIDVILCDIIMSTGGGRELYYKLCEASRGDEKKLIFITGGATDISLQRFLQDCPQPILYKPFQLSDIHTKIESLEG